MLEEYKYAYKAFTLDGWHIQQANMSANHLASCESGKMKINEVGISACVHSKKEWWNVASTANATCSYIYILYTVYTWRRREHMAVYWQKLLQQRRNNRHYMQQCRKTLFEGMWKRCRARTAPIVGMKSLHDYCGNSLCSKCTNVRMFVSVYALQRNWMQVF